MTNAGTHNVYYSADPSAVSPTWTKIEVTIGQYEINVVWSNTELTYNGQPQFPTHTDNIPSSDTTCKNALQEDGKQTNANTSTTTSYTAKVYFRNAATTCDSNYTFKSGTDTTTYTIKKKDVTINWNTLINFTYDGRDHAPTYTMTGQVSDSCQLRYQAGAGTQTEANNPVTSKYTATVEFDTTVCNNNYNILRASQDFTISQAVIPVITKASGRTLTYNGTSQVMVNPGSCGAYGEMQYCDTSKYGTYSNNYTSLNKTDVITETIWFKCVSTSPNYRDSEPESVVSTINKFAMQNFELKLKDAYFTPQNGTVYPAGANTNPDINIDSVTGVGPRPGSSVIDFQNFTSDQNTIWKIDLNNSTWYEASSGVYRMYIDAINNYSGRTQADWLIGTAIVKLNGSIIDPGTVDTTAIPNKYINGIVYKDTPFKLVLDTDIRVDHTDKNNSKPATYSWTLTNCSIDTTKGTNGYEDDKRTVWVTCGREGVEKATVSINGVQNFDIDFIVDKAWDPTEVTAPEAKTLTYDGTAQDLVVDGHLNDASLAPQYPVWYSLDGGTTWLTDPTDNTKPALPQATNAGDYTVDWKIIGNRTVVPYVNDYTGKVEVTINPFPITAEVTLDQNDFEQDGTVHGPNITVTGTGLNGVPISNNVEWQYTAASQNAATDQSGLYTVSIEGYIPAGATRSNYDISANSPSWMISDTKLAITDPSEVDITSVDVSDRFKTIIKTDLTSPVVNWTFSDPSAVNIIEDLQGHTRYTLEALKPGKLDVTAEINGIKTLTNSVDIMGKIQQSDANPAPAAKTNLQFTGAAQTLLDPGSCTKGTIYYCDASQANCSQAVPTGMSMGQYDLTWYVKSNDPYYYDSDFYPLTANIYPTSIKNFTITLDPVSVPYDGAVHSPNMTVSGLGLNGAITSADWELDSAKSVVSASDRGIYDIVVNGKGNYQGTAKAQWMIGTVTLNIPTNAKPGDTVDVKLETDIPNLNPADIVWSTGDASVAEVIGTSADGKTITIKCKQDGNFAINANVKDLPAFTSALTVGTGAKQDIQDADVIPPIPEQNLVYTGSDQPLIAVPGNCPYGTMLYRLESYTAKALTDWGPQVPTGNAPGTYVVSYKVAGDANHNDWEKGTGAFTVVIAGTTPSGDMVVTLTPDTYEYDGQTHTPALSVADRSGNPLLQGTDWEINLASSVTSAVNAGTYTINVNGLGTYSGKTGSANWTINDYSLSAPAAAREGNTITVRLNTNLPNPVVNWSLSDNTLGQIVSTSPDGKQITVRCTKAGKLTVFAEIVGVKRLSTDVTISSGQPGPVGPTIFTIFGELWDDEPQKQMPATGFPTRFEVRESLDAANVRYNDLGYTLMLPTLDVTTDIVSVPTVENEWEVSGLEFRAGMLEGSALPGEGYTVLAAHNHLNVNETGPFALISHLQVNDRLFLNGPDGLIKFSVYANELLEPSDIAGLAALAEADPQTLILLTCENEALDGTYMNRRVVLASPM